MENSPRTDGVVGLDLLLVEDEMVVAWGLTAALCQAGANRVEIASSLADANTLTANSRYDAVLLDLQLSDGTSYALAEHLLNDGVPVIIHSGYFDRARLAHPSKVQICKKPSTPEEVMQSISNAIEQGAARTHLSPPHVA